MKIELTILTENAITEALKLNTSIQEHNLKGLMTAISEKPVVVGAMNATEYLPVIEMVLSSGAVAAGVAGLFAVLKSYFENRKEERVAKINADAATKKIKLETQKEIAIINRQEDTKEDLFEMTIEVDGKKLTLKGSKENYHQALDTFQQQLLNTPKDNDE